MAGLFSDSASGPSAPPSTARSAFSTLSDPGSRMPRISTLMSLTSETTSSTDLRSPESHPDSPPQIARALGKTPSQEIEELLSKLRVATKELEKIASPSPSDSDFSETRSASTSIIFQELKAEIAEDFFKTVLELIKKNDLSVIAKFLCKAEEEGFTLSKDQIAECLDRIPLENRKLFCYFESQSGTSARPSSPSCKRKSPLSTDSSTDSSAEISGDLMASVPFAKSYWTGLENPVLVTEIPALT